MGKRIDITDKLSFDENPVIMIKGKEIEVDTSADTALKLFAKIEEGEVTTSKVMEMAELLLTKQGKKNLDSLKLNINDYATVIETAMDLLQGDFEEGEPENDGTISLKTGI